jgi:hypothetical protein
LLGNGKEAKEEMMIIMMVTEKGIVTMNKKYHVVIITTIKLAKMEKENCSLLGCSAV